MTWSSHLDPNFPKNPTKLVANILRILDAGRSFFYMFLGEYKRGNTPNDTQVDDLFEEWVNGSVLDWNPASCDYQWLSIEILYERFFFMWRMQILRLSSSWDGAEFCPWNNNQRLIEFVVVDFTEGALGTSKPSDPYNGANVQWFFLISECLGIKN